MAGAMDLHPMYFYKPTVRKNGEGRELEWPAWLDKWNAISIKTWDPIALFEEHKKYPQSI